MKLITDFVVYRNYSEAEIERHVMVLMEDLDGFGAMRNCSMVPGTNKCEACVIAHGSWGDIDEAEKFENAVEARAELVRIFKALGVYMQDDTRFGEGEYAHTVLRVEISDLESRGGTKVVFRIKEEVWERVLVLPISKREG